MDFRNERIFNDKHNSLGEIASKDVGIIAYFSVSGPSHSRRHVVQELINKEFPWGYFDGAAGGDPVRCGGGVVLFFNDHNFLHIKAGFDRGTNNFVELMALRLLLRKAWEWGVCSLQIFGDSKIILEWEKGTHRCNILRLRSLLDEVLLLKSLFDFISFSHVYRERNSLVDKLSKGS